MRRVQAEQEVVHLREQKEALEKQVKYLSDERGIEAEMRRQFDVSLPGEKVVVIVDPKKEESSSSALTKKVDEGGSWYMFWR